MPKTTTIHATVELILRGDPARAYDTLGKVLGGSPLQRAINLCESDEHEATKVSSCDVVYFSTKRRARQ